MPKEELALVPEQIAWNVSNATGMTKNGIACIAFPNGIPAEILFSEVGAKLLPVCNNNIRFEPTEEEPARKSAALI